MAFEVRPIRPEDYEATGILTVEIYKLAYPPIEEAQAIVRKMYDVAARVAESETTYVAVETGTGKVLGGVSFVLDDSKDARIARPGEGEFRLLAVDRAARRQGIGQALVQACLDRAAELRLERFVLLTGDDMLVAQRLYDRMGFKRVPERDAEPVPGLHLYAYVIDVAS